VGSGSEWLIGGWQGQRNRGEQRVVGFSWLDRGYTFMLMLQEGDLSLTANISKEGGIAPDAMLAPWGGEQCLRTPARLR
jgi:hypothetical protein